MDLKRRDIRHDIVDIILKHHACDSTGYRITIYPVPLLTRAPSIMGKGKKSMVLSMAHSYAHLPRSLPPLVAWEKAQGVTTTT